MGSKKIKPIYLYSIWADYRPKTMIENNNMTKNEYMYYAHSVTEARNFIKSHLSWLNVYSIRKVTGEERMTEESRDAAHTRILNKSWFLMQKLTEGKETGEKIRRNLLNDKDNLERNGKG